MGRTVVGLQGFDKAISENLRIYGKEIEEAVATIGAESIKKLVKETKATAPVGKRKKHYKNSIKFKTIKSPRRTKYIWYVDGPDYRLSHLLENGHALRNGGRTKGTHFIRNASEPILEEYLKEVEEVIKND